MRIAIVAGKSIVPAAGGQGTFCAQLATGLAQLGHSVSLLTLDEDDWARWADRSPFRHRLVAARLSLAGLRAADLIHINSPWARALILAALLRKPTVITHQDFRAVCSTGQAWLPHGECPSRPGQLGPCGACASKGWKERWRLRLQAMLSRRAVGVGVSESLAKRLGLGHHILSPLDGERFPDLSNQDGGPRLACIGRLVPEKGVDVAIAAVRLLPEEVTLDVFGDGPFKPALQQQVARLGLNGRVRLRGHVPNPVLAAKDHAVVVVPSRWAEPFGYVTAEAMACAKAVVAATTGAAVELLAEDRGWLVPPGDSGELAQTLQQVLATPAERRRRGRLARSFVLDWLSPRVAAEQYERVYTRALTPSR